jgi:hypothetical protein
MNERCCLHADGHAPDAVEARLAHERVEVGGAILLAAGGRFGVRLVNLPDARLLADEVRDEAERQGVEVLVDEPQGGQACLVIRHA